MREDIARFGWMEMKIPGEDCQEMENLQRQESIAETLDYELSLWLLMR